LCPNHGDAAATWLLRRCLALRAVCAAHTCRYDVRFFETVRATKQPAWEAFVVGRKCTAPADGSAGCVRSGGAVPSGWST
jgi:hypothetical protein